jgi:hypothetical protein
MAWYNPFSFMKTFGKEYMKRPEMESSSTFNQNSSSTGSTTPTLDPTTSGWREWLYGTMGRRAEDTEREVGAFQTQGIQNINQNADIQKAAIERAVRSRGLGRTSMGANAGAMAEGDRIGNISNFMSTVPAFRNDLEGQRLGQLQSLVQSAPVGFNTTGTQTSTGNQQGKQTGSSPNWAQDLAQLAAYFAGRGMGGGA